jgi:hypothetical protein
VKGVLVIAAESRNPFFEVSATKPQLTGIITQKQWVTYPEKTTSSG